MSDARDLPHGLTLQAVSESDFEYLLALRMTAMRESLEKVGRFDLHRGRDRFRLSFDQTHTRQIMLGGERVGFVAVKPDDDGLLLDHLYILPHYHRRGFGGVVLKLVVAEADAADLSLRVGALRGSDANRFYLSHGFVKTDESEWDIHYAYPRADAR